MKIPVNTGRNAYLIIGLSLIAALALHAGPASAANVYKRQTGNPSGIFKIDPVHSFARFWIGHLGVSEFPGRFDKVSGRFNVNAAHPSQVQVSVQVPVESLDTNFAQRNKDLLGPDFFNAKQFPIMSFKGTKLRWLGKNNGRLSGNLTLHGVTRPVIFNLRHIGAGPDPWGGYRSGYVATATIRRSNFGMTYMLSDISDAVHVQLNIEGKRQ